MTYNFGIRQARTGYRPSYHGSETHCPSCGRAHWYIGRLTAECAFCCTALPLIAGSNIGSGQFRAQAA